MNKRVLVTGSEGFVGRTLVRYLHDHGYEVLGCDLNVPDASDRFACDISDFNAVEKLFEWVGSVDWIFHLAAITFVPDAMQTPAHVMAVNLNGTIHLLDTVRRCCPQARFIFAGSSEAYGVPQTLPIEESHSLVPVNPYAISKAAADHYCAYVHRIYGQDVVRLRLFNHSGPGQSDQFVLSSLARQLAVLENDSQEGHTRILRTGNLASRRDFLHVNDVVRAYLAVAERGQSGEAYNVCSGVPHSIHEAVDVLSNRCRVAIKIESEPARQRTFDIPEIFGCHRKLTTDTGWEPSILFPKLLDDLLAHWRKTFSGNK